MDTKNLEILSKEFELKNEKMDFNLQEINRRIWRLEAMCMFSTTCILSLILIVMTKVII